MSLKGLTPFVLILLFLVLPLKAEKDRISRGKVITASILVPGLGHVLIDKRRKGALFSSASYFCLIVSIPMFIFYRQDQALLDKLDRQIEENPGDNTIEDDYGISYDRTTLKNERNRHRILGISFISAYALAHITSIISVGIDFRKLEAELSLKLVPYTGFSLSRRF